MKRFYSIFLASLVACCLFGSAFAANDVEDEAQENTSEEPSSAMIRQLSSVDGYQVLAVAGQDIDAAYLEETSGKRHGAIVFFHDQGAAFDSNVIKPLRQSLIDYGWSTLTLSFYFPFEANVMLSVSLESESEENGAEEQTGASENSTDDDGSDADKQATVLPPVANIERIKTALALLEGKGIQHVLLLGHGKGAEVALEFVKSQPLPVKGLILVGMADINIDDDFKALNIPILEVVGQRDLADVKMAVKKRKAEMKRVAKLDYDTREIIGAGHNFYGLTPMLLMTVRSWLNINFVEQGQH